MRLWFALVQHTDGGTVSFFVRAPDEAAARLEALKAWPIAPLFYRLTRVEPITERETRPALLKQTRARKTTR